MKLEKKHYSTLLLLLFYSFISAQYIQVDATYSADVLVRNVLINSPCANVSNISVSGWDVENSYGYFNKNSSTFPFNDGVVLTTGRAVSAIGPNSSLLEEGTTSWIGDQDLQNAIGENNTINATVLEFDFLPLANKMSFEYIFSSEQYLANPGSNQCNFSDGFAFLLREVSPQNNYTNLAVVPGTQIPVKITTVRGQTPNCPAANEQYFGGFNGTEHPTNYNGQTAILKAEATVQPNVLYHIKLVIADQGNYKYDSAIFLGGGSFKVEKDLGPNRLIATGNPLCENESLVVDATLSGTNTYKWFRNGIQVGVNAQYTITQAGIYTVEITINATACVANGKIEIEYSAKPVLNNTTLVQCDTDSDGIAVFDLNKANISVIGTNTNLSSPIYYTSLLEATNAQNPINPSNAFMNSIPNQVVFVRAQNSFGCFGIAEVTLSTSNNTIIVAPIEICDFDNEQDGLSQFDLTSDITAIVLNGLPSGLTVDYYLTLAEAQSEINPLATIFNNTAANQQVIFAKIKNGTDCYGIAPITLIINTFSPSNFEDETYILCDDTIGTLEVDAVFNSYEWNTSETSPQITINQTGSYFVTVTDSNGCKATKNFTVESSSPPTITSIVINDFSNTTNSILVNVSGNGDYIYSLNGIDFQESNFFTNVAANQYFLTVKDKNGCGFVLESVVVLDYPKFFTPNGDGFNDVWEINNLLPNAKINIFDRYGKLIKQMFGGGTGWDGTFNTNLLPSSDYWFQLDLGNNRVIKGHFTLKR